MTSARVVHVEHIWGTVVSIDVRLFRAKRSQAQTAIEEVVQWLKDVDTVFSTYKSDSVISQLRDGRMLTSDVDAGVADVIARCERVRDMTDGLFDPWSVDGGFDPSGLVKGWAADRAAEILSGHGLHDFMINAGGDVTVRGKAGKDEKWVIGIQHPYLVGQICESVSIANGAIATSGLYERGEHITAPDHSELKASSATVIGPDCATADALATALLIAGRAGLEWFKKLPNWSAFIVDGESTVSWGPAFA
jgi:thiamine biosynthesis lipoprotein